jgi:hypothetical protein
VGIVAAVEVAGMAVVAVAGVVAVDYIVAES